MSALITRRRVARLAGYVSTQVVVQVIGFAAGIVLVRNMAQVQYGYYTLATGMVGVASVLCELGLATAVLSIGGRVSAAGASLGHLFADAQALQRLVAAMALAVVLPAFTLLLLHQRASLGQAISLSLLGAACAVLNVRSAMALSLARLRGNLAFQQKLDLAANGGRLLLLVAIAKIMLDATIASVLNLCAAAATLLVVGRQVAIQIGTTPPATGEYRPALLHYVARQAPNAVYYVLSSQLPVWLIGLLGTADRVAEVGALGRLGAAFAIIAASMGAVVQPYFARNHRPAELRSGFLVVNLFFATLLFALVVLSSLYPRQVLWVLGARYAGLESELIWMVLATSLSAWSAALYTVGCARGWVMPSRIVITGGVLSTLLALRWFDVSTVSGSFMLNAFTAFVATALTFGYVGLQLQRYQRNQLAAS